jgi:putative tryptophan/tyrosine transport system substrate-binding protein
MNRSKQAGMAKKAIIVVWLFALALVPLRFVEAQQSKKVPRIGFVSSGGDANNPGPGVEAFRQGLRDLGYIEGKNIQVEYRYIEGKSDRIPSLVAELVQLKVDVLVSSALSAIRVAKKETKTSPLS